VYGRHSSRLSEGVWNPFGGWAVAVIDTGQQAEEVLAVPIGWATESIVAVDRFQ